ncbi:MAG: response regulator [Anaerolineaceae bacterium]|nr:response regulator [Anaerolineaceae bacterium]
MSQKQINNRLNELFSDISNDLLQSSVSEPSIENNIDIGWRWECDKEGLYTFCSDEISTVFNVTPEDLIGKSISQTLIHPESIGKINKALKDSATSSEIEIAIQKNPGEYILARMIFMPETSEAGEIERKGFVQIIPGTEFYAQTESTFQRQESTYLQADERIQISKALSKSVHPVRMISPELLVETGSLLMPDTPWTDAGSKALDHNLFVATNADSEDMAAIAVPLVFGDTNRGILEIVDESEHRKWSEDEKIFVQEIANQLTLAMENAALHNERQRLLAEAERKANELETAAEIAKDSASTLSLDTLLNSIVYLLCSRFGYYHASIFLIDDANEFAVVRESTGTAGRELKANQFRLQIGSNTVMGKCTESGKAVVVNDVSKSDIFSPNPLLPNTHSEMGIPLISNNQVIGALDIQATEYNAFEEENVRVLTILADQIAVAIKNARAYELTQIALAKMEEADRLKSQFLANMSHELRTPLNSIIGFSRVILKGIDGPINDIQTQDLNAIYNSGIHLLNLINDILDLSKIEAGKMELTFTDVNMNELIDSVLSTAVGLIKDKSIKIVQEIQPHLPMVKADVTRIRQVLLNLISNAAKFTEEGDITITAKIWTNPKKNVDEIFISVTDTGLGIAPDDRDKLFQAFSQVDDSPTRKTGGSGLGLNISRYLIEMQGGEIDLLSSTVNEGSTFYLTLPLHTDTGILRHREKMMDNDIFHLQHSEIGQLLSEMDELEAKVDPESVEENLEEVATNAPKLILSIDDNASIIELYERFLKNHGYEVVALTDPKEAVSKAQELQPYAITLDLMMPDTSGWDVLHQLKNNANTKNIPIIICSIQEEEEKGISLGAADFLVKPFLDTDMVDALNRLNHAGNLKKILIIEDDSNEDQMVGKMLENTEQYQVTSVHTGREGWSIILDDQPDLLVLDLFLPDLSGFAILERIRSDETLFKIPIILLSSADLTADQYAQLREFNDMLLSKSFLSEKTLLHKLEETLSLVE